MNITIIGAGQVGTHIASVLSRLEHNVVILDKDPAAVRRVEEIMDVQTLVGHGTDIELLESAGVPRADLVLAVSDSDEVNFAAARIAKQLGARKTVVRARKQYYLTERLRDYVETFAVDRVVCPEVLTAQEIAKRIEHPGTHKLEYFAHGRIQLRSLSADESGRHTGKPLKEIPFPGRTLIASIKRGDELIIPGGDDVVLPGDRITFVGSTMDISRIVEMFHRDERKLKRVVIVGGGLIGFYLAQILERRGFDVTLIERNLDVCRELSGQLKRTEVVHGDATVLSFLEENRFARSDAFAATTSADDTNLMSCLLMRDLGVPHCAVVMHRPDFAPLVEKVGVSYALSPRWIVADTVISMLQKQNVLSVSVLEDGDAEAMELRATSSSPLVGVKLAEAKLPRGVLLAAIHHKGLVRVPKGDDTIEAGDTVVVLARTQSVPRVERLFRGDA